MSELDDLEILRAACAVSGLDGESAEAERALLRQLAERAGVGAVSLDAMIDKANTDPTMFESLLEFLRGDPDATMKTLLRVAVADHRVTTEERVVLQFFADRIGVDRERFDRLLAEAEGSLGSGQD
jgi:tellurite resistance protein